MNNNAHPKECITLPAFRRGNDIYLVWKVLNDDGEPYILDDRNMTLYLRTAKNQNAIYDQLSIKGNTVSCIFRGKNQSILGKYHLVLVENEGQDNMHSLDIDAVELVARTADEKNGSGNLHVETHTVNLLSVISPIEDAVIPETIARVSWVDGRLASYYTKEEADEQMKTIVSKENIELALGYTPACVAQQYTPDLNCGICIRIDQSNSYLRVEVRDASDGEDTPIGQFIIATSKIPVQNKVVWLSGDENCVHFENMLFDGKPYLFILFSSTKEDSEGIFYVSTLSGTAPDIREMQMSEMESGEFHPFNNISILVKKSDLERYVSYDDAVVINNPDAAIFGDNGVALGTSSTKAIDRGIDSESSTSEIIEEWETSEPEDEKFALVKGKNAAEFGNNNLALGDNSMAVGNGNITGEKSAVAFGTGCRALKKYSSSKGLETTSSGQASSSEGQKTISSGKASHSEGRVKPSTRPKFFTDTIQSAKTESKLYQTLSGGTAADKYKKGYKLWYLSKNDSPIPYGSEDWEIDWEDVLGQNITVTDVYSGTSKWFQLSKKLGIGNKETRSAVFISGEEEYFDPKYAAAGDASHTEGLNTRTQNEAEHAEGAYNKSNTGEAPELRTRHSIGIGSDGNEKNAVEVMENGDAYVIGIGGYDGTNAAQPGIKTLQTVLSELGA